MNDQLLYNIIVELLKSEDKELHPLTNFGIFYAPELYIAFIIGKEIKKNEITVLGRSMDWIREIDLKNGGPTDFAFINKDKDSNGKEYAFELKLRDTYEAYCADIEKLKRLDGNYLKYFLALVDSSTKDQDKDPRIVKIEKTYPKLKRVAPFISFKTQDNWYVGDITCIVALWKLS